MDPISPDLAHGSIVALLEKVPAPTFLVRDDGVVRYANDLGKRMINASLTARLRSAIAGRGGPFTCMRLDVREARSWYLVTAPRFAPLSLTRRQREVLELVLGGATNRTIAQVLGIAERTVEVHLTTLFQRAGVENRTSLVAYMLRAA